MAIYCHLGLPEGMGVVFVRNKDIQRSEFSLHIGEDQVNTSVAIGLNHLNRLNWICSVADLNLKSTLIESNPDQLFQYIPIKSLQISSIPSIPNHSKSFNLINSSISPI